ncbi:MAG: hypothetical protein JWP91_4017, partial [Fibrobacteres bacterium]|nr:hypothetical protein [Fibrobacterota bacterium]
SMLMVGYVQLATEPGFKEASEFDLAKAGVVCMIHFYENVQKGDSGYSIPSMERLAGLYRSGALDEYIQAKLRK